MKGGLVVLSACVAGCSSASMSGGSLVVRGEEPAGRAVARYHVAECGDRSGTRLDWPSPAVRVIRIVQRTDGHMVLLESRPRDVLAVDNVSDDGRFRTFQAVLVRRSGARTLREYRVPDDGKGSGTFTLVREFSVKGRSGGFVAAYSSPAMTCALLPEGSSGDIPTAP